jgi:ubiquinone/menaquinone biosynthesis C-methylase UbiE
MESGGREQRFVFGEVAELYDRARAGYPEALVDDVMDSVQGDGRPLRALEVGAGTGKATLAFARRDVEIVALEPSPAMAAVAMRHCSRFPGVRFAGATFEEWPVEASGFDLLFSAQAWHWVDPSVRYVKAAQALRVGGTLASSGTKPTGRASPFGTSSTSSIAGVRPSFSHAIRASPASALAERTTRWPPTSRAPACSPM